MAEPNPIADLSAAELEQLASEFDIEIPDTELDSLLTRVNGQLEGLHEIYGLALPASETNLGERSWSIPDEDPHNAVITTCDVPSTAAQPGPLEGWTVGVKDIIAVAGVPMTCGSPVMRGFVPDTDATVIDRLRAAGARITAKLNQGEFAATLLSAYKGPVTNPHDSERVAGGSSSGSAVAVATGRVDVSLGTDTGGSIRIPASQCGVVGLKPTYGLVPMTGVVENTYTQDHVGPFAETVRDAALVLEAIAGKDTRDPSSLQAAGRDTYKIGGYVEAVDDSLDPSEIAIGVIEEGFGDGVSDRVVTSVRETVQDLEDEGVETRAVSIESFHHARQIKDILSFTELATHWRAGGAPYRRGGVISENYQIGLASRMRSQSAELSEYLKGKLLSGACLVSEYNGKHYTRAQAARETLREEFETELAGVDALVMPTTPDIAPELEEVLDHRFEYDTPRNTRAADVTRLPAITIPCGTRNGMPVGFQLMGSEFEDAHLLGIAAAFESCLA